MVSLLILLVVSSWLSFWIPVFQLLAFLQMNKLFGGIYREHSPLPPGFVNKHNYCYANSTIQCVNTP